VSVRTDATTQMLPFRRKYVAQSFQMPGFRIPWKTNEVSVAASGDLAYGIGTNRVSFDGSDGKRKGRDGVAEGRGGRLEVRRRHLERRLRSAPVNATAALGFAPHSGWSVLVGLGLGDPEARPRLLVRERIDLAGEAEPGSKQPFHAVESLPIEEAARRLTSFRADAERRAHAAIAAVLGSLAADGRRVVGVGILESAGRKGASLEATLASHTLIHTADGDHFRNAIAAAAERSGLGVTRVRARDLDGRVAAVIGQSPDALREALQALRREAGAPWGADQKVAALLAWLVLQEESSGSPQAV
jgi:hypothetical protein